MCAVLICSCNSLRIEIYVESLVEQYSMFLQPFKLPYQFSFLSSCLDEALQSVKEVIDYVKK